MEDVALSMLVIVCWVHQMMACEDTVPFYGDMLQVVLKCSGRANSSR